MRRHLVQVRTRTINLIRSLVRQEGLRLPPGHANRFLARLEGLALPAALATVLAPVREVLTQVDRTLLTMEQQLHAVAASDAVAQRLMTAPGVGPLVALTFDAVLDTATRFGDDARRASAYVGLVPSEDSSAERRHTGHITKTGPPEVRTLLVQASWAIWRSRSAEAQPLRAWAHALAARRGRRIAIIALARRLCRILFAMWRDETVFRSPRAKVAA